MPLKAAASARQRGAPAQRASAPRTARRRHERGARGAVRSERRAERVIKLPRSRESTPVAVTPPSTPLGPFRKKSSQVRKRISSQWIGPFHVHVQYVRESRKTNANMRQSLVVQLVSWCGFMVSTFKIVQCTIGAYLVGSQSLGRHHRTLPLQSRLRLKRPRDARSEVSRGARPSKAQSARAPSEAPMPEHGCARVVFPDTRVWSCALCLVSGDSSLGSRVSVQGTCLSSMASLLWRPGT